MARGSKTCSSCSTTTGPRSKHCPSCGKAFTFKPKSAMAAKIGKDVNWKELKVGEYIKSIQGHGPFYVLEYTDDKEPEVIHMGHYGIFKVAYLEENGIGAYQIHRGHRSGGFCYIYMGKQKIESVTGTIMRPHKIKKVTPRVRE